MADHPIPDITVPVPAVPLGEEKTPALDAAEVVMEKTKDVTKVEKKKKEKVEVVPFLKLFAFADPLDYVLMIVGSIGALANGVSLPIMTIIFGDLVNSFGNNQTDTSVLVDQVSKVALKFVYLGIGAAVASYLEISCWMITGERQAARIRSLYLKTILRQDVPFFDQEATTGEVISRMSGDTMLIQDAIGEKIGKFQQLFATFIAGFVVAFFKGWKLTLVILATLPLLIASGGIMAMVMSRLSGAGQEAYADAGSTVEQVVSSIRTVLSYNGERKSVVEYDRAISKAEKLGINSSIAAGLGLGLALFVMFASYALAMWYGSILVANDGLSGGNVISVVFAVLTGGGSFGQVSPCVQAFAAGKAAAYKMFQVIKRKPAIDAYDLSGEILENVRGGVELRNVDFTYPSRPDVPIFKNFNLTIAAGTTVALVGESGSGKSTVVSLVERFYDPSGGQVLVDGVDIKTLQLRWLRQQIGLVSQEPVLFATSIKENIAYAKDSATDEEVQQAAALANAATFINKMPKGYETQVGERGIQLSGGQKQRIAIARAILKNPRILLLDEATSALDAESEHIVQEALEKVMVGRTTIVVAHRLTTIRNANLIAVIQRGVVVETGTHDELQSRQDGAYSQLIRLQQINKQQDDEMYENLDLEGDPTTISRSLSKGSQGSRRLSLSRKSLSTTRSLREQVGKSARSDQSDAEAGQKKKQKRAEISIFRIAKFSKPEILHFIIGSIAAVANGTTFPVFGLLLSNMISIYFITDHKKLRHDANFWSLMYFVVAIGIFIVVPVQFYTFGVIGQRLIRRIRRLTFEKVLRNEVAWFDEDDNSSGSIGTRLSTDAAAVRSMIADTLSLIVQNIGTIVCGLTIAFIYNWELSLVVLALVPLLGSQGYFQMKMMKGFSNDSKVAYEDASRIANDAISSIRTVSSFCAEQKTVALYEKKCEKPLKSGIRLGFISGTGLGFSNFVIFASYALAFWFGAKLVDQGKTKFANVFKVFFAIAMSAIGVSQSAGLTPDLTKTKLAVNSVFELLDRKSRIDPYDQTGTTLKTVKGDIELRNISFTYPSRPTIPIFKDLSLTVPAGKTVALVGESGSGKSTVISLLERFYDLDGGSILLDGIDIKQLQIRWLRQQIGLVSQEPVLFNTSIKANIVYGREDDVSETELVSATKASNCYKFIMGLPEGFNTTVGERGVQLSGGQKQRVAIARAIVKDPKILLLDEATSALDAESEHVVQEALDRIMVNRTTIVVAHRLSTIRNADLIAVVKDGAIIERGKHDELMARENGAYHALVRLHLSSK
ncbi:ABC transporter B family member 11 [Physcomitrium patens]|nr:ABC transporter B family member 11-like [Physcomitrium patens]|eukprot:XP_024374420.1 ABC transporter B family member 11-like [Physcomitrella patens]